MYLYPYFNTSEPHNGQINKILVNTPGPEVRRSYAIPGPKSSGYRRKKSVVQKTLFHTSSASKNQISVNHTCKFLGLNDYPVIETQNKERWSDEDSFIRYVLPLLASVNPGSSMLKLATLVKAKWFEVMERKEGQINKMLYFNKPRRNRIKLYIGV